MLVIMPFPKVALRTKRATSGLVPSRADARYPGGRGRQSPLQMGVGRGSRDAVCSSALRPATRMFRNASHLTVPRPMAAGRWLDDQRCLFLQRSHRAYSLASRARVGLSPPVTPIPGGLCAVHRMAVTPHARKKSESLVSSSSRVYPTTPLLPHAPAHRGPPSP